jgi:protein TonB
MRLPLLLCLLALPGCPAPAQAKPPPAEASSKPSEPPLAEVEDAYEDEHAHESIGVHLEHLLDQLDRLDSQPMEYVLPFGAGMTPPERISGKNPQYTPEALAARVEGTFIFKCLLHWTGEVSRCRIIKPLPYLNGAVLDAAKTWRFKPATLRGRPVTVDYTFTVQMTLPKKR